MAIEKMEVPEILEEAKKTFEERGKIYNKSYNRFGAVINQMFPDGLTIKGEQQWTEFGLFFMTLVKTTRIASKIEVTGTGDIDSSHDLGLYAFIMEEVQRGVDKGGCPECVYPDGGTCGNCAGVVGYTEIGDDFTCANFKRSKVK